MRPTIFAFVLVPVFAMVMGACTKPNNRPLIILNDSGLEQKTHADGSKLTFTFANGHKITWKQTATGTDQIFVNNTAKAVEYRALIFAIPMEEVAKIDPPNAVRWVDVKNDEVSPAGRNITVEPWSIRAIPPVHYFGNALPVAGVVTYTKGPSQIPIVDKGWLKY